MISDNKIGRILLLILIITGSYENLQGQAISIDTVSFSAFGKVIIYRSDMNTARNLVIMISGDGGWKYGVVEFAKEFSKTGSVVAGVDILKYYRNLRQLNTDCYHVFSDFVELATIVEHKYNFRDYISPVIMGYSSGATLVYGILAQARPGTFIGGISLGFCPDFELPAMLCQSNSLEEKVLIPGKSYLLLPGNKLGNPWIVLHGKLDKVCDFKTVNDFVLKCSNSRLISLDKVGHGFSRWSDFMPQWKAAYIDLIHQYDAADSATPSEVMDPELKKIPYTGVNEKVRNDNNIIAVMLSGDVGWYGFEETLCSHLGNFGIPVIGLDTKKYFWNRKTPEETAAAITELIRYYGKELDKTEFLLCGYSQGAELIPFIFNRLPEEIKSKIKSVVMLSPGTTTDFEIHISNMIGLGNKENTYDVISEIKKNKECRQIIILGENEKTKIPELLKDTGVYIITIPGDHHYQGNTALIVSKMKENGAF